MLKFQQQSSSCYLCALNEWRIVLVILRHTKVLSNSGARPQGTLPAAPGRKAGDSLALLAKGPLWARRGPQPVRGMLATIDRAGFG